MPFRPQQFFSTFKNGLHDMVLALIKVEIATDTAINGISTWLQNPAVMETQLVMHEVLASFQSVTRNKASESIKVIAWE